MINRNGFLLIAIATTIVTGISVFQFNSVEAQSEINVNDTSTNMIGSNVLVITLEEWGLFIGSPIEIIYNSYSETLTVAKTDVNRTQIPVDDPIIQGLKNEITKSDFFNLEPAYPGDGADLSSYVLSITMGDQSGQKSHTVYWVDVALDVPQELRDLATKIKDLP
ncbi:MAG: hypothetical protein ACPKPY_00245 [Nitrososphaeraceae archaeon]